MEGPAAILLVLLVSMAVTALYGWTVERVAYRPLRGSFRLAPLICAIGMSIVLQNYVQVSQGARVKPIGAAGAAAAIEVMRDGGFVVQFSYMQMLIIARHARRAGGLHRGWSRARRSAAPCGPASRTARWRRCSASTPTAPSA